MSLEHSQYCHCVCTDLSPLQEAIERVRAVHVMEIIDGYEHCYACLNHDDHGSVWQSWPCETIKALDGDDL